MVQTVVNKKQAFGVEGSVYDQSPVRAAAYVAGTNGVTVGRVCTINADAPEVANLGGSDVFGGIAINHLEYANYGNLMASLNLPAGAQVTLATFGHVVVRSATAFKIGYGAVYDTTTGAISAVEDVTAEGAVPEGSAVIPNAKFILVNGEADELGVLELSN